MAAIERMKYINDDGFQKRVNYFYLKRSEQVIKNETPEPTDLKLAKAIYADSVDKKLMCYSVVTNATIGSTIDAGNTPPDNDIEYAVITDNQFNSLALSCETAGLI